MRIVPANDAGMREALDVLRAGGVVAHATETCYGLACDLRNPDAVAKLFRIKRRPGDAPVSALFASVDEAKEYVEWSAAAEDAARGRLPGPLTFILPMKADAPARLHPEPPPKDSSTLGVRISSHPLAASLVARFGSPISTTSANRHGEPNPYSAEDIARQFAEEPAPDLVLDSGELPKVPPSTVVDLTKKNAEIRRRGDVSV